MNHKLALGVLAVAALIGCGPDRGDPALRSRADFTSRSDALTVCAGGATTPGIDVSEWQGSINWSQVAAAGKKFAYVRISDGTGHMDPYFGSNRTNAKAAGLLVGAYQFFEPSESASAQAQVVVNAVGRLGNGDLPVMMDVETPTPTAAELNTWLSAVESGTGKRPVIYSSVGLWQQWFPNGGFESYGLFVANWGASCPSLPPNWSAWKFWQYADNGSVSGIGGNVDLDEFNGSLSDLQGYATTDTPPRGYLDAADCTAIAGWAQDQDVPSQAINVDIYFGGAAGSGVPAKRVLADNARQDLCTAIGSCNHGFSYDTPRSLMDGAGHAIHAYGIDANGSANAELSSSPRTLTCSASESGVRRHVVDPTSYSAWAFDSFQDLRHISDTTFNGYTQAEDWPSAPQLIQGSGDPAVYLVDGPFKRHVVSPTSMAEWHFSFSSVQQVPLAQVQAMPSGPDLRERPMLIQASGPEVDVLDDPLPVLDGGSPTTSSTSTSGSTSSGSTSTTTSSGSTSSSSSSTTSTSTSGTTGTTGSATSSSTGTTGTSTSGGTGSTTSGASTSTSGTSSTSSTSSTSGAGATGSGTAGGSTGGSTGGAASSGCSSASGNGAWLVLLSLGLLGVRRRER